MINIEKSFNHLQENFRESFALWKFNWKIFHKDLEIAPTAPEIKDIVLNLLYLYQHFLKAREKEYLKKDSMLTERTMK